MFGKPVATNPFSRTVPSNNFQLERVFYSFLKVFLIIYLARLIPLYWDITKSSKQHSMMD
jgi:hypothetical protein